MQGHQQRFRTAAKPAKRRRSSVLSVEYLEPRQLLSAPQPLGPANVTYHGGPLLTQVQLESVYYGKAWSTDSTLQQQSQQIDGFLQYFPTSPYMDVLKQYNVGHGSFLNHDIVAQDPPSGTVIDDSEIRTALDAEITSGHLVKPNANSLYAFFTAPGVEITANGQNSANDFAGYHDTFTDSAGDTVYYIVVPYPSGNLSAQKLTTIQQDAIILSHEVSEGVTDPDTQTGWFDPQRGEIGDIAQGQFGVLHGYTIQGVWSQADGKVVLPSDTSSPTLTVTGVPIQGTAGQSLTSVVATITGASSSATVSSFTATIDWGDNTTSDGTITVDPKGGFDVTGTHTYGQAGWYPITVTVMDQTGAVAGTALTEASIAPAPPTVSAKGTVITASAGQSFTGVVATFTDANAQATVSNFTAAINWGDGTTSTGTITTDPNGGFDVTGTHTYANAPSYGPGSGFGSWGFFEQPRGSFGNQFFLVTVTIQDNLAQSTARAVSLANVAPTPPSITASGQNVQATSGVAFSGVVATFTSTDTKATAASFNAAINWGDGSVTTGTVTADPNGGFDVTGTHTYVTGSFWGSFWFGWGFGDQHFVVTVGITDTLTQDQAQARSLATVTAAAPNLSVAARNIQTTAGVSFTGVVATFTDSDPKAGASDFVAKISWGDSTSSAGTITADPNGGFDVTGTHTYNSVDILAPVWGNGSFNLGGGSFLLTVTVASTTTTDMGTDQSVARVAPAPANLQATGTVLTAVAGTAFSGTVATFTSQTANAAATNFTATIDWGDGTTSAGTITADPKSGFDVTGTHTYTASDDSGGDDGEDWHDFGFRYGNHGRSSGYGQQIFVVTVTVQDTTNNSTADAITLASVAAAAPANPVPIVVPLPPVSPTPPSPPAPDPNLSGQDFGVLATQSFNAVVATFSDPDSTSGNYNATIDWGDGTTSSGQVLANGNYSIIGTHVYIMAGNYGINIQVTDADGASGVVSSMASVTAIQRVSLLPAQVYPIATALTSSAEYYANRITTAYQTYLVRGPDTNGLAYWVNRMQQGLTDEQLEAGFIGSPEYIQKHGGTGAAWVVGMYHDILGRTPDPTGLAYWLNQLQQGVAPASIAYGFAASPEREAQRVTADYVKYLGRTPSQTEVSYWVDQFINHGKTNEDVIAGFVSSPEDYQKHYNDPRDWIFGAYNDILGRLPDPAGLSHWMSVLS
jgi:hypothetical protein